jgi:transcriptional regulator with XRE-family HTH domain
MLRLVRPLEEHQRSPRRGCLTDLEHLHLARTIRHLSRTRFGSMEQLAAAADVSVSTLKGAALTRRGWGSAGLALRIARAAGVSVEDVLSGTLVPVPHCPACGAALEPIP